MIRSGLEIGRRNLGSAKKFQFNFVVFFFYGKDQVILPPGVSKATQPLYVFSLSYRRAFEKKKLVIISPQRKCEVS